MFFSEIFFALFLMVLGTYAGWRMCKILWKVVKKGAEVIEEHLDI